MTCARVEAASAAGVLGIAWLVRLSRAWRELATIAVIGAYVLAVGWQPSVARAGVAGALASLAWLAARPSRSWQALRQTDDRPRHLLNRLARLMGHDSSASTERRYIHLFDKQRTDEAVRQAMASGSAART